jgi:hypothetical protein
VEDEIRRKILTLLDQHRIMTVATLRPDGWPQATTVGYVNEGLTLYFLCGLDSQKAKNLARDDRISLTIDHDTADLMTITGLSMAAHARAVDDRDGQGLAHAPAEVPRRTAFADEDAEPGRDPSVPRNADGHFRTRLLQGLWAYGSRRLLIASSSRPSGDPRLAASVHRRAVRNSDRRTYSTCVRITCVRCRGAVPFKEEGAPVEIYAAGSGRSETWR